MFEFNVLDIVNKFILTIALIVNMGLQKHTHKYIYIYITEVEEKWLKII